MVLRYWYGTGQKNKGKSSTEEHTFISDLEGFPQIKSQGKCTAFNKK